MSQSGLGGVTLGVLAGQTGMSKSGLFAQLRSWEDVQVQLPERMARLANERVAEPAKRLPKVCLACARWCATGLAGRSAPVCPADAW
jgi:hypothetical protein